MKSPAFQFYTKEFLSSSFVRRLEADELGVYLFLWAVQWEDDGLPDDEDELYEHFPKIKRSRFEKIWLKLEIKFPIAADGKRRNLRLELEREKQTQRSVQQAENAKLGWENRRPRKDAMAMPPHADALPNECQSSTRAPARPLRWCCDSGECCASRLG